MPHQTSSFSVDLLNIPCSPAWTVKIQNLVSELVATPYKQLRSELTNQKQLFIDESPTKQKHVKAWLRVYATSILVLREYLKNYFFSAASSS